jgi:hypothetical protein
MFFRQYYLGCLSHASYLIGDTATGQAVVVYPQRDVDEYLADTDAYGLRIDVDAAAALRSTTVPLDVREESEWLAGHAPEQVHNPLGQAARSRSATPMGARSAT